MVIMTIIHALISGDDTLVEQYYDLLKSWTDYLVQTITNPERQSTADPDSQANDARQGYATLRFEFRITQ
ncbi:hypothetical protein EUX98_g3599 [Antrodiella citrinella]|uniref:Glutaminase A central domain-containing protein n=1 Tax=Antrodiella citrinella TaxID=2447956 RepID=A0A4S4MW63_9APHY|nr:hypothetical protein EUX98_g3599 [Antrodiella citrinella]